MIIKSSPWYMNLPSGRCYKCKKFMINLGVLHIKLSYVSLTFRNGDVRVSITWGKSFTQ